MAADTEPTIAELREAFKRSKLWRDRISFMQAMLMPATAKSMRMQVIAHRKEQQKCGKSAPIQRALF